MKAPEQGLPAIRHRYGNLSLRLVSAAEKALIITQPAIKPECSILLLMVPVSNHFGGA